MYARIEQCFRRSCLDTEPQAASLKFRPSEEIAYLLKWSAVLQGETAQGDHVVEGENSLLPSDPLIRRKSSAGGGAS